MTKSLFRYNAGDVFVLDASVLINLEATQRASDIVSAINVNWTVAEPAYQEVADQALLGSEDRSSIQRLVDERLLAVVPLGGVGEAVYESLVVGTTAETLDDGEAATIGCAIEREGIALIDERKATRLCSKKYADLRVASTVDVLLDAAVAKHLGKDDHIAVVVRALQIGRMQVPPSSLQEVLSLIGGEARACSSLPLNVRLAL